MKRMVQCCHFSRVPCRDLHLANVVVRERVGCRPTYELADLGESKFVSAEAAARHTVGVGATLYMAPEMRPVSGGARRGVQVSPKPLLLSSLFPVPCMLPVELDVPCWELPPVPCLVQASGANTAQVLDWLCGLASVPHPHPALFLWTGGRP